MTVVPTATYRLQFHKGFGFNHARELVPYLAKLGISHVYASPFFRAAPGSMHGYDVCDHNELNPEVGSREEFDAFSSELKRNGLGLIVDFVPNHMGIEKALNPWWRDVLENGPASPFARFFDIDWHPAKHELENKVLLPVLGEQYGRVLESGGFRITFSQGSFVLNYGDLTLPLDPHSALPLLRESAAALSPAPAELESIITALEHLPTREETSTERVVERGREQKVSRERLVRLCALMPEVITAITNTLVRLHDPANADALDTLINAQAYRLSSWRVAVEEINYRRFFDVNTLAAIRMELPEVFEETHRLLFELCDAGHISGVRIDHIDGLAYPKDYLVQLRARLGDAVYLMVEKILGPDERLRTDWPVQGTTGYEFGNNLVQLFVAAENSDAIASAYTRFLGYRLDYREVVYRSKKLVMQVSMASEVNALGQLLNRISESHRWYRDFTVNALTSAIREVIACFPVYRSYLDPAQSAEESDIRLINRAIALARRRNPATERSVFEFLRDVLIPPEDNPHPVDPDLRRTFVLKFQQNTGPITAKGVEDTAFYVFNQLVALNEVGGEPASTGLNAEAFHRHNTARAATFPHCLLATSTHDTKRSEDVRARIAAISEIPAAWSRALGRWTAINRNHRRDFDGELAPDANEEYLLYQTLLGTWPTEGLNDANRDEYISRIQGYIGKALHEAKVNTSWLEPNSAWDEAVRNYVAAILSSDPENRFPRSFGPLAALVAELGALNSLSQTVLKLTCPGVPDIYQGTESWDYSLVDPDNRRPVDYALRKQILDDIRETGVDPSALLANWRDGRIKMFIMERLLSLRQKHPRLFSEGEYLPYYADGIRANCVVAFGRTLGNDELLVVVPRHGSSIGFPTVGQGWDDTRINMHGSATWRDLFTGRIHSANLPLLSELFSSFPVSVLVRESIASQ